MGELVPIGAYEVLPGDTVQHATSALVRAAPLLSPVMHPLHVRIHHWFVPYRLLWDNWEDFITGGPDGADDSVYPTITSPTSDPTVGWSVGSLADYLGVPPQIATLQHSALPFRAYAMIWNEFYRDQDLQTPLPISTADGNDTTTNTALQNCGWEKDYFTSARPWEQKGPAITVPIGDRAPVMGIANANAQAYAAGPSGIKDVLGNPATGANWTSVGSDAFILGTGPGAGAKPNIYADLSESSTITINLLREAFALQRFEEARARYGSRYTEYLRYLGVKSSDARLQRPEYLGGGRDTLQWSEVLQTAEGTNPVGEMRGHGIGAMRSNRYRRYFEEHGIVISLLSARPKTIYAQGLPRMWNRRTKEDFWQVELQHIGQQEIQYKEVYAGQTGDGGPNGTFGFQDRYDEYRRLESSIAGEYRTSTLNHWHMARIFSGDVALNDTFVECVPTERVFAVPSEDVLYIMARHSIQARRLVAKVGRSFIY